MVIVFNLPADCCVFAYVERDRYFRYGQKKEVTKATTEA